MYWQERLAQLLPDQQKNGWFLHELNQYITHNQHTIIPPHFIPLHCLDILLNSNKKELRHTLHMLIITINDNPYDDHMIGQLKQFIQNYTVTPSIRALLKKILIKAGNAPLPCYTATIVNTVLIGIGGTIGVIGGYHLLSAIIGALQNALSDGDIIPLPDSLQKLGHGTVIHLRAQPQGDFSSCGYHTTFNADALDTLLKADNLFCADSIAQRTAALSGFIQHGKWLEDKHIKKIAKQKGLQNLYILHYDTQSKKIYLNQPYVENVAPLDQLIPTIKNNPNQPFHFACNTMHGRHWALISVKYNPSVMIYMDSLNNTVEEDSVEYQYILQLYNKLFS